MELATASQLTFSDIHALYALPLLLGVLRKRKPYAEAKLERMKAMRHVMVRL